LETTGPGKTSPRSDDPTTKEGVLSMPDATRPQNEQDEDRGWSTERVGNDATMKEHSHKEYEARDTAEPPSDPGPGGGSPPPSDTGESTTRRGEDVQRQEGREFEELGKNNAGRPYGTNDPDDFGATGGKKPISEDMPDVQHP
jgi:hypothetical protein